MNRGRTKARLWIAVALGLALGARAASDPGAELFTNRFVRRIQITIPPENLATLRTNARQYVSANFREGTNAFSEVAVHLKGSTGSFRGLDGKPALTLSFDRYDSARRFHGLRKIHLNNSVEDGSYLHELLGGEMFRAAGVPASRVAHAVVELNGRRLGLYVLKEGFTEDFLALYFAHTGGNLYDTGAGHDVDEALRKDLGANPADRADLEALAAAAREPDLARRWTRLQRTLDMDRFLSFMALEILLGHRDGYCLARNNFRVYHDVDTERLIFFPHGMDVLLGNPRAILEPRMSGLAAQALMETPEGRRAYRSRCALLFTNHFNVARMSERIDEVIPALRAALPADEAASLDREVLSLKERIVARARDLERQLAQTPLELLRFTGEMAVIGGWQPFDVPEGGSLAPARTADGRNALHIHAGPMTSASWRAKVLLPPGRYRFEGLVRVASVARLDFGKNHGASLRVVGAGAARSEALVGDQIWKRAQVSFQTTAREQEVELIGELRASSGDAWFDTDALRLVREK